MSAASAARMRARPVRWPWLAVIWFIVVATAGFALVVENGESVLEQVPFTVAFALFGVVGALIVSRARNRIGALLLWGSASTALSFVAGEATTALVRRGTTTGPVAVGAAAFASLGWVIGILPVFLLLPLLFPDGRLPSRRWRPLAWLCVAFLVLLGVGSLLTQPILTGSVESAGVPNPLFIPSLGEIGISEAFLNVGLLVFLVGSVGSLIVRFRRARGVERQQIKWVAATSVLLLVSFVLSALASAVGLGGFVDAFVVGPAFVLLPVSIGIGVLQYRLYDLDVVVKKALIAGTLVVSGIAVYGGVVWVAGSIASDRASSVSLFVIALILGMAFRPVVRFARRVADRLVYGRRATPYEVLTEFSGRVGEAYATEDVLGRMARILGEGVGAEEARVWLLVAGELRPEGAWPAGAEAGHPRPVRGDALPGLAGEMAVEVRDRGELLGALSVRMSANDPMTPPKERLVRDLASQAGLVLRNVRLVEELRASQRRLVAAQDEERRRIERNIHDGAQQQLVALAVKLRLAQGLASKDPSRTEAMLLRPAGGDAVGPGGPARPRSRDLPTAARRQGPRGRARGAGPQDPDPGARSTPDGIGRYPQEAEAAAYFCVLEALQNVSKYADATRAMVRLGHDEGHLTFEVQDDGAGFDAASTGYGTGLRGMADRLGALDGEIAVESAPGRGTTVQGRIPVEVEERQASGSGSVRVTEERGSEAEG